MSATAQIIASLGVVGPKSYSTSFPTTENPISQGGIWINGGATGLDWTDVRTTTGLAFGTEVESGPDFTDSTAVLTGTWAKNQQAQATINIVSSDTGTFEEVAIRLNTTITAHSITGYEILFSVKSGDPYRQIIRWNGALGDFTTLASPSPGSPIVTGDVVQATNVNGLISLILNGSTITTATDTTYTGGSPGMGFYLHGGSGGVNSNYGFSAFSCSEL